MQTPYQPILAFWFLDVDPAQWFTNGPTELDGLILQRFAPQIAQALRGELDAWAATPRGRLALILLLDQFTRNAYRDTPQAYAGDAQAQQLAHEGVDRGMDKKLSLVERHFFYMPFMHAEDRELQALSLAKFAELAQDAKDATRFATGHAATVERFGRFPHRNAILDRDSSPEENAYLASRRGG